MSWKNIDAEKAVRQGLLYIKKVVGEVFEKKDLDESNNISASHVKGYSGNMSGSRPHDIIPWDRFRHEPNPCPACNHCFTQAIELPINVSEKNMSINTEKEKKMKAWESKSCKGQKPPSTSTVSQILACYCTKHFSGGHQKGIECHQCELLFQSGVAPNFKM
eukprot:2877077-Ditylum_brightwellii.AAC.1